MAEFVGTKKFILYVESSGGLLRHGSEEVWSDIRDQGKALKPRLGRLVLVDEDANDVIATAAPGVRGKLRRQDTIGPIVTAIVTALVLVAASAFGHASPDLFYGSATALVVGILYVGYIAWSLRFKELVWR
jgi:hypothetical protein